MTKDAYPALFHFIHKQMVDINYPVSKAEVLAAVGNRSVNVEWDKAISLETLITPINQEMFSCAADFYCALIASFRKK